ncbi:MULTISPECIES: hypothetical protein [Allobacillus]|uniref:Uncharacterized protein n=1 Tax=Allobacillus salarius TaxID=1955272 RepID=A0A556PDM2_9BACI|nr:hypothetical protein [Allobacillus salarius]TSJ62492.1 hypothetical protein FPQ13_09870 [Allobacillus salarius]
MVNRESFENMIKMMVNRGNFDTKEKQFISKFFSYRNLTEENQNQILVIKRDDIDNFISPNELNNFLDDFSGKVIKPSLEGDSLAWYVPFNSVILDENYLEIGVDYDGLKQLC